MNIDIQSSESLFSMLSDVYPEVTLSGHIVILCLIALGTTILFSTMIHILFSPEFHVTLLIALQRTSFNGFCLLIYSNHFFSHFSLVLIICVGINCHLMGKNLCFNDFFCVLSSLNTSCNLDHYLGQPVMVIPILRIDILTRWVCLLWEWVGIAKD